MEDLENLLKLKHKLVHERTITNNVIYTIQELSELTKVLTNLLLDNGKFHFEDLVEEMSHCLLMIDAIKLRFNIPKSKIELHQLQALYKCFKGGME